ncbi:MAG: PAS domain-containing protein [Bacteroidota bacterium]|nr:PAS domain-containing protein [Bacteroidota bacterium]
MKDFLQIIELLETSNFYYIITTSMDGKYSYVNSHYAKSFSYISDAIVGMPYYMTMHPDDTKVCEETAAKCFANPSELFPATIRKHDGKGGFVITQWEYRAMFKENGEPEGIFCLGYDITKYIDEQQQLKQAESEIEKRKEVLKEIAFQHSHLIRSPLSNILGLTAILEKMDVDTNVKNICKMIVDSSINLDNIIREVVGKSYR